MATQILRTVDRWHFETPLALVLAGAAAFAVLAMPHALFGRLPVAGHTGTPGHIVLALLLALVCGIVGYRAMRRPANAVPADEDIDLSDDIDAPSGVPEDRLVRLRRADRHPDAPPRAPIRASRDLGEPFMDVGAFVPPPVHSEPELLVGEEAETEAAIVEGDYVEVEAPIEAAAEASADAAVEAEPVAETPDVAPIAEPAEDYALGTPFIDALAIAEAPSAEPAIVEPLPVAAIVPRAAAERTQDQTIAAMMERLSAGMERRAGRPVAAARDMRPALRDALDELNRLAERRG